jgi:16S rRNA (guanine527-N7)-methyltransferase
MDPSRISALLEPFFGPPGDRRLTTDDLDKISTYIDLLLRWNARINLTSIRDPEQIVTRHFGESFFLARYLFPDPAALEQALSGRKPLPTADSDHPAEPFVLSAAPSIAVGGPKSATQNPKPMRVVDLGSGAGFPALPIKIWAPHIHLTLIESNHKKAIFLRELARAFTLTDINVIPERAEAIAAQVPNLDLPVVKQADVVTFRAVEKFTEILPTAIKFLAPDARLAILITTAQQETLKTLPGMTWATKHIPQSHTRLLAIGKQLAEPNLTKGSIDNTPSQ